MSNRVQHPHYIRPAAATTGRQYSNSAVTAVSRNITSKSSLPLRQAIYRKEYDPSGRYLGPPKMLSTASDATFVSNTSLTGCYVSPSARRVGISNQTTSPTTMGLCPRPQKHYIKAPLALENKPGADIIPHTSSSNSISQIPGVTKYLQRKSGFMVANFPPPPKRAAIPASKTVGRSGDVRLLGSSQVTKIGGDGSVSKITQVTSQIQGSLTSVAKRHKFHIASSSSSSASTLSSTSTFSVRCSSTCPSTAQVSRIPSPIWRGNGLRPRSAIIPSPPKRSPESVAVFQPPPKGAGSRVLFTRVEWSHRPVTKRQLSERISSRVKVLGKGGQGQVELWRETGTGKLVAVKVTQIGQGSPKQMLKSKAIEMRVLEKLRQKDGTWHSCMSGYGDTCYAPHRAQLLHFVEYIDGYAMVRQKQFFTPAAVKAFLVQAVSGLKYLHSRGVIHRDLKPENFMLTHKGEVKFIDFGLALWDTLPEHLLTERGGTRGFLSPEVEIQGIPCTTKVDIWALAICVIDLMVGKGPKDTLDTAGREPPSSTPKELKEFLSRCFEKDPSLRPSAEELSKHPLLQGPVDVQELLKMYQPMKESKMRITMQRLKGVVQRYIVPK